MRAELLLAAALFAGRAEAQVMVTSPPPERVAITIYRDPDRGVQPFNLSWLGGYALVSETRHVRIPSGESELRFEGVTAGLVPQSAIITGLGTAVIEKNRDARLLSPGGLLDASLGERLILRRTNRRTGAAKLEDAIVRATNDGVVIESAAGIEALHCTGLAETLLARSVPPGLSATPTLSVRVLSPKPIEGDVTLSYISNNFDWQADYVAELSNDGRMMSLFGWVTLANGDDVGLVNATTNAVAGKLNRTYVAVESGRATPIAEGCWPEGRTDEVGNPAAASDMESIVLTGSRLQTVNAPPAPPPPPPPAPAKVIASEERLGDVRLYRIPIRVSLAARSQKQIAMLERRAVKVEPVLRLRVSGGTFEEGFERVLRTRNDAAHGLGLALPAGTLELFQSMNGHRLLVGEGQTDDRTIGEKVEFLVGRSNVVRARQVPIKMRRGEGYVLSVTNADPQAHEIEVELPLSARADSAVLAKSDGGMRWNVLVPRNGRRELRYTIGS